MPHNGGRYVFTFWLQFIFSRNVRWDWSKKKQHQRPPYPTVPRALPYHTNLTRIERFALNIYIITTRYVGGARWSTSSSHTTTLAIRLTASFVIVGELFIAAILERVERLFPILEHTLGFAELSLLPGGKVPQRGGLIVSTAAAAAHALRFTATLDIVRELGDAASFEGIEGLLPALEFCS